MDFFDMSNQPTRDVLIQELLAREAEEDRDEHPFLTADIVDYLLKNFMIVRRKR